jgi:hypothetical protein
MRAARSSPSRNVVNSRAARIANGTTQKLKARWKLSTRA